MAANKHKIPVSGYNPRTKELFFSWRSEESGSSNAPDRTLVLNLEYGHASYVDHGFTAMTNYQSYNQKSLRDFMVEAILSSTKGICECDDSATDIMQGDPYVVGAASGGQFPSLWNASENTSSASDNTSLCAALGSSGFEAFCEDGTEGGTFVMASSSDNCLKQYEVDYYKRDLINSGGSAYTNNTYESILESGAHHFNTDNEKTMQRVTLEYSGVSSEAVTAAMKFGRSNQPDQLLSGFHYTLLDVTETLDDQSASTSAQVDEHTIDSVGQNYSQINPDDKAYFNNYTRGRYLGYQLKLTGAGPATLSRITLSTRLSEK